MDLADIVIGSARPGHSSSVWTYVVHLQQSP